MFYSSTTPRRLPRHLRAAALVLIVPLLFLGACASNSTNTSPATVSTSETAASAITVTIQNFAFRPANFTVGPGATITVINEDQVIHTLTADGGTFSSGEVTNGVPAFNSGDVTNGVPVTFQAPMQPGSYPFHDHLHRSITGVLTVT